MTRAASNSTAPCRPNGAPRNGWECRSSCAKSCTERPGRRSSRPSSPTACSPGAAASWRKLPSRATTVFLNDLYFLPGGNPGLNSEKGIAYEAGLSFAVGKDGSYTLSGSASWYDQHIDDWILWLPTAKGFFSPVNIKKVHAYGVEIRADLAAALTRELKISLDGTFSWAPSVNEGEPMSPADQSVGKQLPYEPEYSATATGRLSWRSWGLLYQFCYYSERYTMSSNDITLTGRLTPYLMSNLSLEKGFSFRWADLTLKGTVNNLFNEEYLSVLSRPMPRMNAEFFIGIKPKWRTKKR